MAKEKKVIDASVIVKWFLNEDGKEESLKLRDDHIAGKIKLVVPDFAFLEVINVLRYKNQDQKLLEKANNDLWDAQLHIERLNKFLIQKASQIALENNLSMYDALYAALSLLLGTQLITFDKDLAKIPNTVLLDES